MLHGDLKYEAIAKCFRSDEARTASFLNESPNTLIGKESLEIYVF